MTYHLFLRLIVRNSCFLAACGFNVVAWLLSGLLVACFAAQPQVLRHVATASPHTLSQKFAQLIEDENEWGVLEPHIAKDAFGNEIAVWEAFDGVRYRIWSKRRILNSTWGITSPVENNAGNAYAPRIAFDATGNALAVWHQEDATRSHIWTNRYVLGRGWGVATRMEVNSTGNAQQPQIVADAKGNAMAVWQQIDSSHSSHPNNPNNFSNASNASIRANRYHADSGWGVPVFIENKVSAQAPQLAGDANGNFTAVWHIYDGKRTGIRANHFDVVSGWGRTVDIESNKLGAAYNPHIEMASKGYAQIVWQQIVGAKNHVWLNHFKTGSGWGNAKRIVVNGASVVDMTQMSKSIVQTTYVEKASK